MQIFNSKKFKTLVEKHIDKQFFCINFNYIYNCYILWTQSCHYKTRDRARSSPHAPKTTFLLFRRAVLYAPQINKKFLSRTSIYIYASVQIKIVEYINITYILIGYTRTLLRQYWFLNITYCNFINKTHFFNDMFRQSLSSSG